MFAFTTTEVNPIALSDYMAKNFKWSLNCLQEPLGIHIAVTDATKGEMPKFVSDLK